MELSYSEFNLLRMLNDPERTDRDGFAEVTRFDWSDGYWLMIAGLVDQKNNMMRITDIGKRFYVQVMDTRAARSLRSKTRSDCSVIAPATKRVAKRSHLKEHQVAHLKYRVSIGISDDDVAKEFGISRQMVYAIRTGRAWKHVVAKEMTGEEK